MKSYSTTLPATPSFSALLDIRGLQPGSVLCKLSENLGPSDQVNVYGTLDSTATSTSANITLLGSVYGNQGDTGSALTVGLWPYLFAQRVTGSATGTIFASGSAAAGTLTAPSTTALPSLNAFSAAINLSSFGLGSVRIGLDKASTSSDVFNVYGTNDPSFVGTAGGQLINQISGGGSNNSGSVLLQNFQYVYVQRTAGSTAGNLLAWGADDTGESGSGSGSTPYAITYRQGATTNAAIGLYGDFPSAWAAVLSLNASALVVDSSLAATFVPAGSYTWPDSLTIQGFNYPTLALQQGATFSAVNDPTIVFDNIEILNQATSTTPFPVASGQFFELVLRNGTEFASAAGATVAMITNNGTGSGYIGVYEGSIWSGVAAASILNNGGSGGMTVVFSQQASLFANSIAGAGTTHVLITDGTVLYNLTQSAAGILWNIGGANVTAQVFANNATAVAIADGGGLVAITGWTAGTNTGPGGTTPFNAATGVFTAPVPGFYTVDLSLEYAAEAAVAGAEFTATIEHNGSSVKQGVFKNQVGALSQTRQASAYVGIQCAIGDTISLFGSQNSGSGAGALSGVAVRNTCTITWAVKQ